MPTRVPICVMTVGTDESLDEVKTDDAADRVDVFAFTQGYSKGAKAGRVVFHGVADVFTLGLWEVIETPTEAIFDGDKVSVEVTYDVNDKVQKVTALTPNGDVILTAAPAKADTALQ